MFTWSNIKLKDIFSNAVFVRVTVHNMSHDRKIRKVVYYEGVFRTLLTVLSKAFDFYSAWPYYSQTGSIWFINGCINPNLGGVFKGSFWVKVGGGVGGVRNLRQTCQITSNLELKYTQICSFCKFTF